MGNTLQSILNRVGKVVHGEDTPLGALTVMLDVPNAVEHRVPHVEVAALQINFGPEGVLALGELPILHAFKQVQRFLDGPVPPGGASGGIYVSAVLLELFRSEFTHIGQTLFNKSHGQLIGLVEVVGAIKEPIAPVKTKPMNILLDCIHKLSVLFSRIGVVHAQVADAAEFFRRTKVNNQRLAVSNVEITVGLRWETGVNLHPGKPSARGNVLRNKFMDKVLAGSGIPAVGETIFPFFRHSLTLLSLWWD